MKETPHIYLISPDQIDPNDFKTKLEEALATGHVAAFQLRLKNISDENIITIGKELIEICHKHNVQFILNDRVDLAKEMKADGVHLGEEDGDVKSAKNIMGENKIVGISCYDSIDRAMQLAEQGADYVSFGAFYPTKTKIAKANPKPEILTKWREMSTTPVVAIGGIDGQNYQNLLTAGADLIAVISFVWQNENGIADAIMSLSEKD